MGPCSVGRGCYVSFPGVLCDPVEDGNFQTGTPQGNERAVDMARGCDARVRDHQHAAAAKFLDEVADEVDHASTEEDPTRRRVGAPGVLRFERSLPSLDSHGGFGAAPYFDPIANTSERVAT